MVLDGPMDGLASRTAESSCRPPVNLRGLPASPAGPKAPAVEIDSGPLLSSAAGISGTRDRYAALRSLRLAAEVAGSCTVM